MASLPLLPADPPRLIGIARLAAQGSQIREGHLVEYFTLPVRSVLNRCVSKRPMPFAWTINPYRGCEFACKYCYARYTHEFMEMREGIAFERKIFVKQQAAALLRQELRQVKPHEEIALGTATDPYQPAEKRYQVTRGLLEEFARHSGLALGIITKSDLILRDLDLLAAIGRRHRLSVSITVTTTDAALARLLEPRAPRPDLRLEAVRRLNRAGIHAGVSCCPVLPAITDSVSNLDSVVQAAARAGARHVYGNPLFLKPCSAAVFLPFLEQEFPQLAAAYRERYRDTAFVSSSYRKRILQLIARLREKHGIRREHRQPIAPDHAALDSGGQLELFAAAPPPTPRHYNR